MLTKFVLQVNLSKVLLYKMESKLDKYTNISNTFWYSASSVSSSLHAA